MRAFVDSSRKFVKISKYELLTYVDTYININYVDTKERGEQMSPRTGRPTDEPKNLNTRVRLSNEDVSMLEFCCQHTGKKKSEIIRLGIKKVYDELKK